MAIGFLIHKTLFSKTKCVKPKVNLDFQKDNPKVVHAFDIEELGDKAVYCRCWRSKKFPYCDGAHTKHNQETGDNVGPLIIKRKDA
ncbi:CDGSH iron-sulfur domain-containing protein 1 [Bagarius yarrelli]|uniref:CDGSH iron-sulfur domain-containing protein 1 n=1 Tax=Bagarius yarrelli TaxID=175774 RepID=A0A556TN60_BAGYA|nr:CDGSH iron-sulfur domain-containing protein 1 [Bagarius yarrelli]